MKNPSLAGPPAARVLGKILIADAGHSRLKLHVYGAGRALHWTAPDVFGWPEDPRFCGLKAAVLIGTASGPARRLAALLKRRGEPRLLLAGRDCTLPIHSQAKGAGSDRLAQALGARLLHPGQSCVIASVGSALVVDHLDEHGRFQGGLIGLGFARYLAAMKALSPALDAGGLRSGRYPARTTAAAVLLGWIEPAAAGIRALARRTGAAHVLLTGGDARLLQKHLPGTRLHPHLGADGVARALGYR